MKKSESKYFNTAALMDEALIALLRKKDLKYITVKEVCEKAGVNRSTFYLHYETLSDLTAEAMEYVDRRFFCPISFTMKKILLPKYRKRTWMNLYLYQLIICSRI